MSLTVNDVKAWADSDADTINIGWEQIDRSEQNRKETEEAFSVAEEQIPKYEQEFESVRDSGDLEKFNELCEELYSAYMLREAGRRYYSILDLIKSS